MKKAISIVKNFSQFLPLSLFATYSFRTGAPSQERLFEAFMIGAIAAAIQLLWVMGQQRPANRLILGANLWLLIGGVAAYLRLWEVLQIYKELREAGIFVLILLIGLLTTVFSPTGYIGGRSESSTIVRRYSLLLLLGTILALSLSLSFRGNTFIAAVLPIVFLVALNRLLNARLNRNSYVKDAPT